MTSEGDGELWEEWEECYNQVSEENLVNKDSHDEDCSVKTGDTSEDGLPSASHIEILQRNFGHSNFRPVQWDIIQSILEDRRDNCVIMATGYGKSLTYQYPPVYSLGLSVVISPLISLMQDQVLSLKMSNIPACYLGSAQTEKNKVTEDVLAGKMRVLYITPEFCTKDYGSWLLQELAKKSLLTLVAIDEAHCVSQWGHDFRADYRKLGSLRKSLPAVPFLALTATATLTVRKDICDSLNLKNPKVVCTGFDRPNLYLSVSKKSNDIFADLRQFMVKSDRNYKFDGSTIIYCQTKKSTEEVYSILKNHHIICDFYHAERKMKERSDVHVKFVRDELPVIIATVAFGMGIDKPDVRNVIHWGAPRDVESYYQEVGRAGRDGLPARCHVFYANQDFRLSHFFNKDLTGAFLEHRQEMSKVMERYLDTTACRRQSLLMHFEGKSVISEMTDLKERCCDNCTTAIRRKRFKDPNEGDANVLHDFTSDAELLLKTVQAFSNKVGASRVIQCLRGSKNSTLFNAQKNSELHGKGKHQSEDWWKALNRLLLREGYLETKYADFGRSHKGFPCPILALAKRGQDFLSKLEKKAGETSILLAPGADLLKMINKAKKKEDATSKECNVASNDIILPSSLPDSNASKNSLMHYLLRLRKDRANELNCAPFHLASNQALIDMSSCRPSSVDCLRGVDGFNDQKIERDGQFWITHIVDFCKENGLELNITVSPSHPKSIDTLSLTAKETYVKFQKQKKSLEDVMAERKLTRGVLVSHLCSALKLGFPVDLSRAGVHQVTEDIIVKAIRSPPVNSNIGRLKPIKENCPDFVTYEQIHLVVAHLTALYSVGNKDSSLLAHEQHEESTNKKAESSSAESSTWLQAKGFSSSSKALQSQKSLASLWQSTPSTSSSYFNQPDLDDTTAGLSNKSGGINSPVCEDSTKGENLSSEKFHGQQSYSKTGAEKTKQGEGRTGMDYQRPEDEILLASEIDWDEDLFESDLKNVHMMKVAEEDGKLNALHDTIEQEEKMMYTHPEDSKIGRSSSDPIKSSQSPIQHNVPQRSNSSNSSNCQDNNGCSPVFPKRKMPEWLTKPNAQAEVKKKMKKNSLFKV